ncbi:type I restriction system specificity protein [Halopseudomonas oceani]|uniref:Restriction endonuclease subunit S n=1 Tax=Halopseudomonas oceani TaxID=1708783 RepID=A0A2P4EQR0_9GAMM|nr:restriction endonuclease subunit S [Halopseudomonas oceani]POB00959.1 restriction endonuclease subunit S [Halopseudomonas oceani]GGE58285.1 type I restriction system specificity protein [Halopseudomonas oceani]
MSSEWPLKELEFIANEVTVGYVGSMASEYVEDGVPFLRSLNIEPFRVNANEIKYVTPEFHKQIKKSALRPGDVAIVRTGKPGTCAVIPDWLPDANCSDLVIVRCGEQIRPRFLCYWVNSVAAHHISSHIVGAVQQHFNVGAAKKMKVAVPDISTQDAVVEVLGSIDDRITLLRETNATLEAIAQALFKSWFVDFDPVRAKAEGSQPEGAIQGCMSAAEGRMPKAAMDATTAALFPDSFEESELGLVPKGWRIGTVDDLCAQITNGGTPSRSRKDFWEGGSTPWFKTGEFCDGFLLEPSERITDEGVVGSSVKLLPENAILMAIYAAPTVGRLGILTEPSAFNQACTGMVAKGSVGPWFLYLTLYFGRDWFNSRANGAAQQNISKAIVAGYSVVIPDDNVLKSFNENAELLFAKIRAGTVQAQTLTQLRDTLLPRLMSGQLRLPEAESLMEKAL